MSLSALPATDSFPQTHTFTPSNKPHNFIALDVNIPGTSGKLIFSPELSGVLPKMEPVISC